MTNDTQKPKANSLWGGRFEGGVSDIMEKINASIDFDKLLYRQDIQGSIEHCRMLAATGIISNKDAEIIQSGLKKIEGEIEAGEFEFSSALEDIHMNI
jgi:argininosuccinate lyase